MSCMPSVSASNLRALPAYHRSASYTPLRTDLARSLLHVQLSGMNTPGQPLDANAMAEMLGVSPRYRIAE